MRSRSLLPALCAVAALVPASAVGESMKLTPVPNAAPSIPGMAAPNTLSPELVQIAVAEGAMALENPTALLTTYGYAADGPMVPPTNAIPGLDRTEASKTEPDKNTYLVLADQKGPDAAYDYGTHFLFQGHEDGLLAADRRPQGYLTRVNLDADATHRITLMADRVSDGRPFPFIDGSTFDPFADRLLLTGEGRGAGSGRRRSTSRPRSTTSPASPESVATRGSRSIPMVQSGSSRMPMANMTERRGASSPTASSSALPRKTRPT